MSIPDPMMCHHWIVHEPRLEAMEDDRATAAEEEATENGDQPSPVGTNAPTAARSRPADG